ncbi:hydroxyacid oxidase 1 [Caerostris darwini]|uniref:(S)-2-hydroxy-acid oxidase n=1 Tax=Caerostris darwini TaxID=1538125 RepID=A0AAV4RAQ3_9ARAC|nr:hydroxyacid oxidase 1 [Caerostris darwini]
MSSQCNKKLDMTGRIDKLKTLRDFEKCALEESLDYYAKLYFSAGACSTSTPKHNEDAFSRYKIRPRVLRDVSKTNIKCAVLDCPVSCPVGISPTAVHCLAHSEAELATVRGCCGEKCIFVLSSTASCSIEEIATEVSNLKEACHTLWMQTYIHKDRSVTWDIIKKAESFGFSAIVVTVDSTSTGLWMNVMPEEFFEMVSPKLPNLPSLPRLISDTSLTFEDLKWVVKNSKLPVIAKGILSGEDAKAAVECGVSAIIVSNHGGRLIERVVPTLEVLEEVVDAVSGKVEVYLDGGIRSGSDVFIALALGAKSTFIGRPAIWGLSLDGENGVRKVLQILKEELLMTMQLAGAETVENIKRSMVVKI